MKKVVSLLLVLVLALGMSTVAFATAKMDKAPPTTLPSGKIGFQGLDKPLSDNLAPGSSTSIPILPSQFAWDSVPAYGTAANTAFGSEGVVRSEISASRLTIRTKISKGSNVIKKCEITYDRTINGLAGQKFAQVYIEFVNPFKSNNTDGQEFDFTVYPVVDGRAWADHGAQVTGTLVNETVDIDGSTDYVDFSYGPIGVVSEYSRSVEYALGEGVSLFGRAIKSAKYWGVANKDATEAEDEMMAEKGIDEVYHLSVIGLNNIANHVNLTYADPSSYVYDKDLNYLGLAKENLPFSETYYLAAKMLEVEEEEEPEEEFEEEEGEVPVAPPVTGGEGTVAPTYDNPSTGK